MKRLITILLTICLLFPTSIMSVFADTGASDISISFHGNSAEFTVKTGNGTQTTDLFGTYVKAGMPVGSVIESISDPKYWDSQRKFVGWQLCTKGIVDYKDTGEPVMGNIPIPGYELFSSTEVLSVVVPNTETFYRFVAVWDTPESDYMSHVLFDSNGGTMKLILGSTSSLESNLPSVGASMREHVQVKYEMTKYFSLLTEPYRNDAVFEGWAKYLITWKEGKEVIVFSDDFTYTLISDRLYTTNEVLDSIIPEYDVAYVAKWSNEPLRNYFIDRNPIRKSYDDVPSTIYYYKPVSWASAAGITTGKEGNIFSPDESCTRAQVVTFLWRTMGSPEPQTTVNPFVDVKSGIYYDKAVRWAVENGITVGTDATHFSPNDTITRAQAVTFMWRLEGEPSASVANPFEDVRSGIYYENAVLWAVERGITTGKTDTTFEPLSECNRAQIVTFLYRAYGR